MVVSDAAQDPRLSREMSGRKKLRGQLVCPHEIEGKVTGTICVAARRRREFNANDIELMTAIANQIGVAIDQARIYQKQCRQLNCCSALRRITRAFRKRQRCYYDARPGRAYHGVNRACEKLLGYTAAELSGKYISEFLRGRAIELAREVGGKLLDGETIGRRYEQHIMRRDGTKLLSRSLPD